MTVCTRGYHPKIALMMDAMDANRKIKEFRITADRKKLYASWYWFCRDLHAFDTLRTLDKDWKDWFDNNENVPEKCAQKERALLIEQHLRDLITGYMPPIGKLYNNIYIWHDRFVYLKHSISLIFKESDFQEFVTESDARDFIDTLSSSRTWYGTIKGRNE